MTRKPVHHYTDATRAAWNDSARYHAQASSWPALQAAAARPGFSVLDATLTQTLRGLGVAGKTVGQVCCNNARELLSLPSLGGRPLWGIDGSQAFLDQGAVLARACAQTPEFICADVYDVPDGLAQVDVLLITIGVLNWMPDLPRFCDVVAGLIAPGGHLVIYETHPALEMFDPEAADPFTPTISYFERAPHVETNAITYDGSLHATDTQGYWFQHTLGEVVTGIAAAGLTLCALSEHPHSNRESLYDIYEGRAAQVPMSFTLIASQR